MAVYTSKLYIGTFVVLLCLALVTGVSSLIGGSRTIAGSLTPAGLSAFYAATLVLIIRKHRWVIHLVRLCAVVFFAGGILGLHKSLASAYPVSITIVFAAVIVVSIIYFALARRCIHIRKDPS